jgi:hypothetical protein
MAINEKTVQVVLDVAKYLDFVKSKQNQCGRCKCYYPLFSRKHR